MLAARGEREGERREEEKEGEKDREESGFRGPVLGVLATGDYKEQ